jgi:hypothetical protein
MINLDNIDALCEPTPTTKKDNKTKLTPKHEELIQYLRDKRMGDWNVAKGQLTTHTAALALAHADLSLKGEFKTIATGKKLPEDRNCVAYPRSRGSWYVVRFGAGVIEADTWHATQNGFAACLYNSSIAGKVNADMVVRAARDTYTFFVAGNTAYAEVIQRGHPEILPVASEAFSRQLRLLCAAQWRQVVTAGCLHNSVEQLEAHTKEESPKYDIFVRLAGHKDKIYLDLADADRTVIEIDAAGWRPCESPPVRFVRPGTMLPLPVPEKGGTANDLKHFVNVGDDEWYLLIGVLIGFLNPDGPYPLLQLIGGEGRGKSTMAKLVQLLLDPTQVMGCSPPCIATISFPV